MMVVGLDLSLRSTGCVAVPSTFSAELDWSAVRHRLITTDSLPQGASVRERVGRLLTVAALVAARVREDGPVDVLALEMQAFSQHHAHARELGELTGIVCAELLPLNIPIVMVTASAARKTLLGNARKGAKAEVSRVLRQMGAPWTDSDRSDAFAVANHVLSLHGFPAVTVGGG